jgi:euchromatic histone-lysine N-methyltransferase
MTCGRSDAKHASERGANPQGFQLNPSMGKENSPPRDSKSIGFATGGGGAATGCRKGRKALVPWRFQIGYKRTWSSSQGLSPIINNGSDGPPGTRGSSKFEDGSRQCAPATARKRSRVQFSAAAQVQTGSASSSVPKEKKITPKNRVSITRESVMASLHEFRVIYKTLLEEEKNKRREQEDGTTHDDLGAFQVFRERFCVEHGDKRYEGSLPGVQVGDVFDSNKELFLVGLHRSQESCVDYIKKGRACLAVSIVSYEQHSALNHNLDFLLHVGSTAATADQKMEGTDMALKRSMDNKTQVRVIYRSMAHLGEHSRSEGDTYYVYGGLYLVEKFCREKITEDQFVNTFHLRRMPGQPHIDIQELVKKRMAEPPSNGTFVADISVGLENIPISAINSVSNEYPMPFSYISHMQYPINYQLEPPSGCDCVGGCLNSPKCACAVKNGGKIPFSKNGRTFGEKPLVYECGPSCKCPPTCHNRVSQRGIKFRLQVFKTKSMGWGVRTLDFIPNGSFVCEYTGELVKDEDAEKTENDEYLFNIGHNYYNVSRWDNLLKTIPSLRSGPQEGEVNDIAVDALKSGNFARFINHSCSGNLFSQNVLYDHDNKSMPHIVLFADVDIPPLQPLSYDYNYTIDGVRDPQGNIKKKKCLCGSSECNGWLY